MYSQILGKDKRNHLINEKNELSQPFSLQTFPQIYPPN